MVLPSEPEFEQALTELTLSLGPFLKVNPEYQKALDIVQIPERIIQFRVVWEDDKGQPPVNRGFRSNSALGPYKGGLRLHPSVNLSILKFLGFEQKNALTGLNMGSGKGGSDFNPKGKSDNEIRRFCVAFMSELSRHIGQGTDVPAGDIGTGAREIGFLFGQYRKMRNEFVGVLTGKGMNWGGSFIRPEATGYGLIYYVERMIEKACPETNLTKKSTCVAISGSGNVAQYTALKVIDLGATVVSLSDSRGSLIATTDEGFTRNVVQAIMQLKLDGGYLESFEKFADAAKYKYYAGQRPWTLVGKVDIALPSATQNEVSGAEAEALVKADVKVVAEGSNMGCDVEAIEVFEAARRKGGKESVWYAPGKASNCGGVAVSGLEMAQNSQRLAWTSEEVDRRLKGIMSDCAPPASSTKRKTSSGIPVSPTKKATMGLGSGLGAQGGLSVQAELPSTPMHYSLHRAAFRAPVVEPASPASSSEMSPVRWQMMEQVRMQRQRNREFERSRAPRLAV